MVSRSMRVCPYTVYNVVEDLKMESRYRLSLNNQNILSGHPHFGFSMIFHDAVVCSYNGTNKLNPKNWSNLGIIVISSWVKV